MVEISFRVRYAETDRMGITHHAVYPVWFEMARTELCRAIGVSYTEAEQAGVLCPLVNLQCSYHGTTTYDDEITLRAWVGAYRGARTTFRYAVYANGTDRLCCTGETEHAWVDAKSFAPLSMRKHFPLWHEALMQAVEER